MKSIFFSLGILVFTSSAFAGTVHQFNCRTQSAIEERGTTAFEFQVKNLEQGKISYVESKDPNGIEGPVKMTPKDSALMLNDNGGIIRTRAEKDVVLESDGDGIQLTTVRLYANSDYSSGYVQIKFSSEENAIYSKVSCEVQEL